ncbi:MAG: acyloxyacyl hydrolase [Nitrospirales bacterium]
MMVLPVPSSCQDLRLKSIGIRAGHNFEHVAVPPPEKQNFQQYDIFADWELPWSRHYSSGWEISYGINSAAGILRGGGKTAFNAELGPGTWFYKPSWKMTIGLGTGLAVYTRSQFGKQDFGGPVQIMGQGGISFDIGWNLALGWRFHHISDATVYGSHSKGVDLNFIELRYDY